MLEITQEKYINDSPLPVSIEGIEVILEQMKKCVCKIKKVDETGTGFFAKIPYQFKFKYVLITNNHILSENDIQIGKIIKISMNNEKEYKTIKIGDKRLVFTNKAEDVTIIEIEEKDNIKNFIEIDERYNQDNIEDRCRKESLYILNYPKGDNMKVSFGLLEDIKNNNLYHLCTTEPGSSGSPIISLKTFKLLGVHIGGCKNTYYNNCNIGLFIKYLIDEFNKKIKNNLPNIKKNKEKIEDIKKKFEENITDEKKSKKSGKEPNKEKNKKENKVENIINIINNNIAKKTKENKANEITIKYKIDKEGKMKLFGKDFIKNNKNKCIMIIEGKEEEIKEYINIDKKLKDKNILEIKLKEITTVTDMSYMFFYCSNLTSLSDLSRWDIKNVTNMNHMFSFCFNLTSLPDINKWNIKNVTDISYIFYNCNNLSLLPDISKWKNVTNKSYMFEGCNKLKSLPF